MQLQVDLVPALGIARLLRIFLVVRNVALAELPPKVGIMSYDLRRILLDLPQLFWILYLDENRFDKGEVGVSNVGNHIDVLYASPPGHV